MADSVLAWISSAHATLTILDATVGLVSTGGAVSEDILVNGASIGQGVTIPPPHGSSGLAGLGLIRR